jgi:L-threonylcarbamoyladenylate synthase
MTDIIRVHPADPDPEDIARAAACLRDGGLVAFPTETVYGLGAHALDRAAVARLFEAKGRPASDPLIVHVIGVDHLPPLVQHVPDAARVLAERFWPGALTLVLGRSSVVPDAVTAGLDTVAVRVPSHPVARALLLAAGVPVAAPSANLFSRPSPTTAAHVMADLDGRIDMVVDGGSTEVGIESTVLDLSQTPPVVLRPGAVTLDMLRRVLPGVTEGAGLPGPSGSMPSPGLLAKHYSPRAPLMLYEGAAEAVLPRLLHDARVALAAGQRVGIVAPDEDRPACEAFMGSTDWFVARYLGPIDDLALVASRLYAVLREVDAAAVDLILAHGLPATSGLGVAVQDRLRRAAAGRTVDCSPTA